MRIKRNNNVFVFTVDDLFKFFLTNLLSLLRNQSIRPIYAQKRSWLVTKCPLEDEGECRKDRIRTKSVDHNDHKSQQVKACVVQASFLLPPRRYFWVFSETLLKA